MADLPKLAYRIEELALAAGVGRSTIFNEIKAGRLQPAKIGRRTVIPVDEGHRWLKSLQQFSAEAA